MNAFQIPVAQAQQAIARFLETYDIVAEIDRENVNIDDLGAGADRGDVNEDFDDGATLPHYTGYAPPPQFA